MPQRRIHTIPSPLRPSNGGGKHHGGKRRRDHQDACKENSLRRVLPRRVPRRQLVPPPAPRPKITLGLLGTGSYMHVYRVVSAEHPDLHHVVGKVLRCLRPAEDPTRAEAMRRGARREVEALRRARKGHLDPEWILGTRLPTGAEACAFAASHMSGNRHQLRAWRDPVGAEEVCAPSRGIMHVVSIAEYAGMDLFDATDPATVPDAAERDRAGRQILKLAPRMFLALHEAGLGGFDTKLENVGLVGGGDDKTQRLATLDANGLRPIDVRTGGYESISVGTSWLGGTFMAPEEIAAFRGGSMRSAWQYDLRGELPEHFWDQFVSGSRVDARKADVYRLGLMFFQALGVAALEPGCLRLTAHRVERLLRSPSAGGDVHPVYVPDRVLGGVSGADLRQLLREMLCSNPESRPAMAEVVRRVDQIITVNA